MAVGILVAVPSAQAAPGDVYVSDATAQKIFKLPPTGGDATELSADPDFTSPYGMTLGPDGLLYVADQSGKVFKVDRSTGTTTEVTDLGVPNPIDVGFDAQGRLLMVDYAENDILAVNRSTGVRTPVFDGPGMTGFNSIVAQRNGAIYIADEGLDKVYRLSGGTLTPIIENDPDLNGPNGLVLSPDERFLYVGSFASPRFFRYDLRTGQTAKFEIGLNPYSLALLPSNRIIFSDQNNGDLDTVGLTGGPTTEFSSDPDIMGPRDIVVEPKLCAGRVPTIVGTNGRDVIRGSRFADIISTLGGNDVVRGLGGNDVVCLGGGRDRAFGGKGRDLIFGQGGADRLFGQAGPDRLVGGAGPDRLIGGKGRDRLFGGRGRDRLIGGKARDVCRGGPGRDIQRAC